MDISWRLYHKESCFKLRYVDIIECLSQGKLFKVAVCIYLTNRRQFSMVYTLIDHQMTSKNVQNSNGITSRRRVVSLPSFGHFTASFDGL